MEEKKERYLFISCAGSGYQNEIAEFLKNTYIKNGEYYDNLSVVGSIYPLLFEKMSSAYFEKEDFYTFKSFRDNLLFSIQFLVKEHNLTKIVVVSEPECAFYKYMYRKEGMIDEFYIQKKAFYRAVECLNYNQKFFMNHFEIEVWYMFLENGQTLFEKFFDSKA